jgi:hypothetical protein
VLFNVYRKLVGILGEKQLQSSVELLNGSWP